MTSGIFAMYAFDKLWNVSRFIYYGLLGLQHRGQETAGICLYRDGKLSWLKGKGFVDTVFNEKTIEKISGYAGIGCVSSLEEASSKLIPPVIKASNRKVGIVMDGAILNMSELRRKYRMKAASQELAILNIFARKLKGNDPMYALIETLEEVQGVYSLAMLLDSGELLIARDPYGLRPLCIGALGFDLGTVSSETCALEVTGNSYSRMISPGEVTQINLYSIDVERPFKKCPKHCIFEFVYLSRLDSMIENVPVYDVRLRIGRYLAKENPVDADIVLGVPQTALSYAVGYSMETGIPYGIGFVSTGRVTRSAIRPTEIERIIGVQLKLNPIKEAIAGKRVVVIDDSVVRGTTLKNLVYMLRRKGAKEVHVRIGSPHIIAQCPFGATIPTEDQLIARWNTEEEIAKIIGADSFAYLSLESTIKAVGIPKENLCCGCFTEEYPKIEKPLLTT